MASNHLFSGQPCIKLTMVRAGLTMMSFSRLKGRKNTHQAVGRAVSLPKSKL
jgi:hypothetical protein